MDNIYTQERDDTDVFTTIQSGRVVGVKLALKNDQSELSICLQSQEEI